VVNVHTYSQWADITSTIGGGITSTTNMSRPHVFDLNNDNYPDFLVPVLTNVVSPYIKYWKLFKNNGNSTFTDVTTSYGLPTNLTSTLAYTYFSDRMYAIGTNGRGNLVDKGYGSLDFIAKSKLGSKLNLSLVIKNILDPKIERVQENTAATINVLSYKKGISAGFSLNYQF
jgi:hypothetical protein